MDETTERSQQYYTNERNYEKLRFLDFQNDLRVCKKCGCIVHESKYRFTISFIEPMSIQKVKGETTYAR